MLPLRKTGVGRAAASGRQVKGHHLGAPAITQKTTDGGLEQGRSGGSEKWLDSEYNLKPAESVDGLDGCR